MRKLKLTLKKEIISDLESNEIKGGKPFTFKCLLTEEMECFTKMAVKSCVGCLPTVDCHSDLGCTPTGTDCHSYNCP
jgi:hypothetical protein